MARKVLIVSGGWDGHEPQPCAELLTPMLEKEGFEVDHADSLDVYADGEKLRQYCLIVPNWTCGAMTPEQENGLSEAVMAGVNVAGFHGGLGDGARNNTLFQWMAGGQFVAHPDNQKQYTVNIADRDDPVTAGLSDFSVTSEQYYMHVDPMAEVLATTTFEAEAAPWVNGCVMPVVWKKMYGKGRVFYSSLGHVAAEFDVPEVLEILRRGMLWAAG